MFTLFIYAIVIIAMVATLGAAVLSLQKSADVASAASKNVTRIETVVALMRSASRPLVAGGAIRLPAGETGLPYADASSSRTLVPTGIVGDNRTPWGTRYGLCPRALTSSISDGTATSLDVLGGSDDANYTAGVVTNNGASYVASVTDAPDIDVFGSLPLPDRILGFVVAPSPNSQNLPLCNEIIYRDGAFVIGKGDGDNDGNPDGAATYGGSVAAILADTSALAFGIASFSPALFVSVEGTGSGGTPNSPMGFDAAITYWKAADIAELAIEILDGSYSLDATDIDWTVPAHRHVTIESYSGTGGVHFTTTSPVSVAIGAGMTLNDLDFGSDVGLVARPGAAVEIRDSILGALGLDGGAVRVYSDTSIAHTGAAGTYPIDIGGGRLDIVETEANDTFSIASTETAATMQIVGGTVGIAADLVTPSGNAPWAVSGAGEIRVNRKLDGSVPQRAGADIATSATVSASSGTGTVSASCYPYMPYVKLASCAADSGALRSSRKTVSGDVEGWQCDWANDVILTGSIPVPATAGVTIACSANPLQ